MPVEVKGIDISIDRVGFDRFLKSWLCLGRQNIVVDVGPASGAASLLGSLKNLGVESLDLVLLTHIHIDHCGALGAVLAEYPEAKAVCFAGAKKYLVDPEKLWIGSLKVLGKLAESYGRPGPLPAERLLGHDQVEIDGLKVLETPGHAQHHVSYSWQGHLFSGEAGGNLFLVQGRQYVRPATPPRFFLPVALNSLDLLLGLPDQTIHFGHYEEAESSREMLGRSRRQLLNWREIIGGVAAAAGSFDDPDLEGRCLEALLEHDPELAAFSIMNQAQQERERFFITNSVKGYLEFLSEGG